MQRLYSDGVEPPNGAPANGTNGTNGANGHMLQPANRMMVPLSSPPASEKEGGLDLHAIWNAFRRRWFLAISLGLVFGIPAAIGLWFVAPAPYVTFAEIRLNSINTQAYPGSRGSAFGDFNIRKQAILKRATHPFVLIEAIRPPEISGTEMIREQEPHSVAWLEKNISVASSATEYIRVQLEGENPKELAEVVNAIANALVEDVESDLVEDRTTRRKTLDTLIAEKTRVIQTKMQEMDNLKNEIKVDPAEIERRQSYLVALSSSLRSALVSISLEKLKFQGQQLPGTDGELKSGSQIEALIKPKILSDPKFQQADEEVHRHQKYIETFEKYLASLAERVPKNHPSLAEGKEKLAKLKQKEKDLLTDRQKIREEIQKEILGQLPKGASGTVDPEDWFKNYRKVFEKAFEENEQELKTELEKIKAEQKDLDRYSLLGDRLKREIERAQTQLEQLQDESNRLKFELENAPTLIEMSREAKVPHERSLKKKTMMSGVGGLGVFGFFVAGIVFLEYRTQRIATLNQVHDKLNLRVMGAVPLLPRSAATGNSVKKKAKNALWYSALTEAVDSTRTLLIRGSQIESLKTVMIASAVGGEGKTTMASHLATSLARGGRKILLVDCDLRRPCIHRAFDLPASKGVCEILRGEEKLEDCIQELDSPHRSFGAPGGKNQSAGSKTAGPQFARRPLGSAQKGIRLHRHRFVAPFAGDRRHCWLPNMWTG